VAREGSARISSSTGAVLADPGNDLLKIVFIERVSGRGERFVGFVRGWGQKRGAVASSLVWDAAGIVAIGADDLDLAQAINRVIELQGGTVLAVGGEIAREIPFPIGGYSSDKRIEELTSEASALQQAMKDLGSTLPSPRLTLETLASAAIPFIRITEKGYFRFRENDYVGL
jgi:adenine deaminase